MCVYMRICLDSPMLVQILLLKLAAGNLIGLTICCKFKRQKSFPVNSLQATVNQNFVLREKRKCGLLILYISDKYLLQNALHSICCEFQSEYTDYALLTMSAEWHNMRHSTSIIFSILYSVVINIISRSSIRIFNVLI